MINKKTFSVIFFVLAVTLSVKSVNAQSACSKADINQDNTVDLSDYSLLVQSFLKTVFTPRADINLDGAVDLTDYSMLVGSFLQICSTQSTISPTPSAQPTTIPTATPISSVQNKIGNCPVFPTDNPWNQDISTLPVHSNSANFISSIGSSTHLHPDFGGASVGESYGIPFITVTNAQSPIPINFTAYGDESDPGPYPIPLTAPIEGGPSSDGDRHVLAINTDTCMLYEMYRSFPQSNRWDADAGAVFNLQSNALRPKYWTSTDAAGLSVFAGLIRYSEVQQGSVNHAIRFTVSQSQKGFISPARHYASSNTNPNLAPMGLRVRLKSSYNISSLTGQAKIIAQAMKKYGMIVADNGSNWYFQADTNPGWNDNDLNQLKSIPGSAFEAVNTGAIEN